VQRVTGRLLDAIERHGPDTVVDLVESFAFPLPYTVICELLGFPEERRASFGRALGAMLVPTPTPEAYERAKAASEEVVASLHELVAEKRRRPDGALVTALLDARDGGTGLSEQELGSTIFQLIVAGHDTTASLIGNAVVALLTHPDQLARLRACPELVAGAVEELIRFDAPVPHATFRYTVEPIELGGVAIPAGAQVIVNLASANRDEQRTPDPDTLDVTRSGVSHLGFGHGIHFCLGAPLARMEGQIALGQLIQRFPGLRLAGPPEDLRWGHGDGLVLRGLTALPVITGPAPATGGWAGRGGPEQAGLTGPPGPGEGCHADL
jgi:cytochrome P450